MATLLFISHTTFSQIINVEKSRKVTDTIGFAGGLSLQGSYLDNEGEFIDFSIYPDVQYKTEKDLFLLIGGYSLTKTDGVDFRNSGVLHLRYNRKVNPIIRLEAFQQIQNDAVNRIDYRYLSGAGVRMKLVDVEFLKTYLGITPMLELERAEEPSFAFQRDLRLSNYLSFTLFMNDNVALSSTTYYQPVVNQFIDYRLLNENRMGVNLGKRTSFDLISKYIWDNEPPIEAPRRFVSLSGGLSFSTN